jgi:hypothetical protein
LISIYERLNKTRTEIARLRDEINGGTRVISLSGLTSIAPKLLFYPNSNEKSTSFRHHDRFQ